MILIERFCGVAAHSLEYHGTSPPITRLGSKRRFAPILRKMMGLPRQPPALEWLNDLDVCCVEHQAMLRTPEARTEVARMLRGWIPCPCTRYGRDLIEAAWAGEKIEPIDCEPVEDRPGEGVDDCLNCKGTGVLNARVLWERLRSAPVPGDLLERAGTWGALQLGAFGHLPVLPWTDGRHPWGMHREEKISTVTFDDREERATSRRPEVLASRLESLTLRQSVWCYLQSRAFSSKPVTIEKEGWQVPGFLPEITIEKPWYKYPGSQGRKNPRQEVAKRLEQWTVPGFKSEWYGNNGVADGHGFDLPRWTVADKLESLSPPACLLTCLDATTLDPAWLPDGDLFLIDDPPYSAIAPMVPPTRPAFDLFTCSVEGPEWYSAFNTLRINGIREAVFTQVRMALFEMFRTVIVKSEIREAVVQGVMVYMMNDLVWAKWASYMLLHEQAMLANIFPIVPDEFISRLHPPVAASDPSTRGEFLPFKRHFRRAFASFYVSLGDTPSILPETLLRANDVAALAWGAIRSNNFGSTDVTEMFKRHCNLLYDARHLNLSRILKLCKGTTGYKHDSDRARMIESLEPWARKYPGMWYAVHEAVPLEDELRQIWPGAKSYPIGDYASRKSTLWGKGKQREFVTLNREAVWTPQVQQGLF